MMGEEEEEEVITLQEYIEREKELEKEAVTRFPGKFESCTYSLGYIKQNIFVCLDCKVDNRPSGICYSCALSCHYDCDLVELFAKRNFKCDCGSSCLSKPCTFKENINDNENNYNSQNFDGKFCICKREYDENDSSHGLMFQCLICEDWFHEKCIENCSNPDNFEEFVCSSCSLLFSKLNSAKIYRNPLEKAFNACISGNSDLNLSGPVYLKNDWRSELCRCTGCTEEYKRMNISFILQEEPVYVPESDDEVDSYSSK